MDLVFFLILLTFCLILLLLFLESKKRKKSLWIKSNQGFINLAQSHYIEKKEREQSIHICHDSAKTILSFPNDEGYQEALKEIENIILG